LLPTLQFKQRNLATDRLVQDGLLPRAEDKCHERQFKKLLESAEDAVQMSAEKDIGRRLTKAELKKGAAKFRAKILGVIKLLKEKYPVETAN
jgi:hypothetical protein